jgi:hypothetical protein
MELSLEVVPELKLSFSVVSGLVRYLWSPSELKIMHQIILQCQVTPVYFKAFLLNMSEILLSPLCITYLDAEMFRYIRLIQSVKRVVESMLKVWVAA